MSEEEELAIQLWVTEPSEELTRHLSTSLLFDMLEVYHTSLMDAFQSFQRVDFRAYQIKQKLYRKPQREINSDVEELERLSDLMGIAEGEISSQRTQRWLVVKVLAARKLTYVEQVKFTVEVTKIEVKIRRERAAMADLKEAFKTELEMAEIRIDATNWRTTPEALEALRAGIGEESEGD
ncbi:MAG: hypothetical protein Q9214_005661 [Letrouitia sp. 1 TL-2023]